MNERNVAVLTALIDEYGDRFRRISWDGLDTDALAKWLSHRGVQAPGVPLTDEWFTETDKITPIPSISGGTQ